MSGDDPAYDRRTVLRTTGAALGGVVGGAGVAAADHFSTGDCVVVAVDSTPYYTQACPLGDRDGFLDLGTEGDVGDTCTDSDGGDWVKFVNSENVYESGWVWHDDLDHC